jgi:hypothetical protein
MGWVDSIVMAANTSTRDRVEAGEWTGRGMPLIEWSEGEEEEDEVKQG